MSKLTALHEAMSLLDAAWADAGDESDLSREQLIAASDAIGVLQRRLDAVHVTEDARCAACHPR